MDLGLALRLYNVNVVCATVCVCAAPGVCCGTKTGRGRQGENYEHLKGWRASRGRPCRERETA